jgi:hypothetical protein
MLPLRIRRLAWPGSAVMPPAMRLSRRAVAPESSECRQAQSPRRREWACPAA